MAQWVSMGPPEAALRRLGGRLRALLKSEKGEDAVTLSVKIMKKIDTPPTEDVLTLPKGDGVGFKKAEDSMALPVAKVFPCSSRVLPTFESILAYASISKPPPPPPAWGSQWIRRLMDRDWIRHIMRQKASRKLGHVDTVKPLNGARVTAIVGIHGWAVTQKILQNLIGMPCSSELYTTQMAAALRRGHITNNMTKTSSHTGVDEHIVIEVPLNGHGRIMERVEAFVQNSALKEALERSTDLIVVAHSQGVPVGTLLLERLHAEGALTGVQNITLVAMAGIFHGPFPQLGKNILIQYMETESSRELFELHAPFMVPSVTGSDDSQVPKIVSKSPATEMAARLRAALLRLLHAGVRVIAVGSWMDQLVPLYSSTLYGLFHPNITRLLYIEGSGVAHHHSTQSHGHDHVKEIQERDSFLPLLLTLCLSIKNAGFSDHGLLVYLSEWIAGSIVNGDNGHSSIYADPLVYESAAQIIGHSLCSKMEAPRYVPFEVPEEPNHYHVPWMMHALVTDSKLLAVPIIRQEIDAMVLAYACWRPRSKALRDLKRKLAALGTYGRASL